MCICLALSVSGCGTTEVIREPQTRTLLPPAWMATECPQSPVAASTIGDALDLLPVVIDERDRCAAQVDALRRWRAEHEAM
ncbi:Rz1-like lysis system protein LysC [Arhodomonas sp. AD133]|uniref:Rz1-like lysis system protein LysC n=1 Tax=Arhodomonas sp. AD133 TaxID=3415009 RepID=UPI003EBC9187